MDVLKPNAENKEEFVAQIVGTCPTEGTTCTPAEEAEHPFSAPSHVAVSALTGEVFVLDGESTVDVFKPVEVAAVKSFEYVRQFVAPAGVNFKSLIGITVDGTEGDVYLASAGRRLLRVHDRRRISGADHRDTVRGVGDTAQRRGRRGQPRRVRR